MSLDVRRLRVLREVAERGTIAAAAHALSFTPSAVSQQLAALEREAGVELLARNGRGVALTDAGWRLVAHTERVLALLEEAEADLDRGAEAVRGPLRVAAFPTAAATLVPAALSALREQHPDLVVAVEESEPEAALPALRLGELDLVVSHHYDHVPRPAGDALVEQPLLSDPMRLALPVDDPAAEIVGPVPVAALREHHWIAGHPGTCGGALVEAVCRSAGYEPRVVARAGEAPTMLALVAAGTGVALVPRLALGGAVPEGVALRDLDPPAGRRIVAVARAGGARRAAVEAAIEALEAAAGR